MIYKTTIILLLTLMFVNGNAQKSVKENHNNKCKLILDKEINREVYENGDTQPVFADTTISETLFVSEKFKFKVSSKNHKDKEWVQFAYMIEKNGSSTFLKVITPKGDLEVEEEAKRIISLMPIYKPAMCGQDSVPMKVNIRFPMHTK